MFSMSGIGLALAVSGSGAGRLRVGYGRLTHGRNRIDPSRMPGVASQQASDAEPAAAQHPMVFHGFHRILRAARVEAAVVSEKRAQKQLIGADRATHDLFDDHR